MRHFTAFFLAFLGGLFGLLCAAFAQEVSESAASTHIVEMRMGGTASGAVTFRNTGDVPLTFVANTVSVADAGTESEMENLTRDVMALPKQFTLKPGATQRFDVRFVSQEADLPADGVYRVRLQARSEASGAADASAHSEPAAGSSSSKGGVVDVSGPGSYEVLVVVRPKHLNMQVSWTRDTAGNVTIKNEGTTAAHLHGYNHCRKDSHDICAELPEKMLFAGESWTFSLPNTLRFEEIKYDVTADVVSKQLVIYYPGDNRIYNRNR